MVPIIKRDNNRTKWSFSSLKTFLVIRRVEFIVVEITIFLMPVFVAARSTPDFSSHILLIGAVVFFLLYSLGDIINCFADRDLDRAYKKRLSDAVFTIGVSNVRGIIYFLIFSSLFLGVYLAIIANSWTILVLIVAGMFLGIEYSIGPFHFKSRGILHLICLWLLLFFLPMLYAGVLVEGEITEKIVALALSYATLEMGIILVNTSEDLPEDLEHGIQTTTVFLGLRRTLMLALSMVSFGSFVFIAFWFTLFYKAGLSPANLGALLLIALTCIYVFIHMLRMYRDTGKALSPEAAVAVVKNHGKYVPVWATAVGWTGLIAAAVYLFVPN